MSFSYANVTLNKSPRPLATRFMRVRELQGQMYFYLGLDHLTWNMAFYLLGISLYVSAHGKGEQTHLRKY